MSTKMFAYVILNISGQLGGTFPYVCVSIFLILYLFLLFQIINAYEEKTKCSWTLLINKE